MGLPQTLISRCFPTMSLIITSIPWRSLKRHLYLEAQARHTTLSHLQTSTETTCTWSDHPHIIIIPSPETLKHIQISSGSKACKWLLPIPGLSLSHKATPLSKTQDICYACVKERRSSIQSRAIHSWLCIMHYSCDNRIWWRYVRQVKTPHFLTLKNSERLR